MHMHAIEHKTKQNKSKGEMHSNSSTMQIKWNVLLPKPPSCGHTMVTLW